MRLKFGQTLIELMVAIGMLAVFLPALLTGLVTGSSGKVLQDNRREANLLLQEELESLDSIRNSGWNIFAVDGTYHTVSSGSSWSLVSGSETVSYFTRQSVISPVYRSNGAIVTSGGTLDASTKKVTVSVSWTTPLPGSISAVRYFTRYMDNLSYVETSKAQFDLGTKDGTTTTDSSGGEVVLAPNNHAKWCSPTFSASAIDLPDGPPVAVAAFADTVTNSKPNQVFVATAPSISTSTKMAHITVTANSDPPVPSLEGTFTLDPAKYSNSSYIPVGINLDNNFKTTDIKYYQSSSGSLYALITTDNPDRELIAVKVSDGLSNTFQDPINKIYKYWSYFNTKMFVPTSDALVNGNFETGNMTPYTTIINSGTGTNVNSPVYGGSRAARVTTTKTSVSGVGGGGACPGGNRVSINPGTNYNFSSYLNVPSTGNSKFRDARIRVVFYDSCTGGSSVNTYDSNLITTTNTGWIQVSGSGNSGASTFAEFQLLLRSTQNGSTSTAYFDDLTLTSTGTIPNDQNPFGYGASNLTILGDTGYLDSGGYLYAFNLANIDSKSSNLELDQIGCRILLDGYECKPGTGIDRKYSAGETGASWSDTTTPAHNDCSDGGNIELNANHQLSGVQVGSNKYIYVSVGAGTNPELDVVDVSTPPTSFNNSCGRGGNTGWKVVGSLDFDTYSGTEEAANSVYAKSDGTRAYMSSNGGIMHNGIPDSDQFYIIDTTTKSSPRFLSAWPSTQLNPPVPTPPHYINTAQTGYYNGDSTNIQLYPRRALTVLNGQRAVIVGQDGVIDSTQPQEYQVLNIDNEQTPIYCGGLNFSSGFNDLTSVNEADGDNFVYMVANTTVNELKIIQGGPDGNYAGSGTFQSQPFDPGNSVAFNRLNWSFSTPANTSISLQVASADKVNGACTNANYYFVGPDGTPSTNYTASGSVPLVADNSSFKNPGQCFKYKATLSSSDMNQTPIFSDFTVGYSP